MDWMAKMKQGMKLIAEACKENENWNACEGCPFCTLCDAILLKYSEWSGHCWDMSTIIKNEMEGGLK